MARSNKSNPVRDEYMRVRKALQRRVSSYKKKGYTVPENYVPAIPKNVREGSIRRIERLSQKLSIKATYTTESGEVLTGKRARVARSRQKKKEKAEEERKRIEKKHDIYDYHQEDELEGAYDYYEDNVIEEEEYDEGYIDNYLSQFDGTAFGEVLEKTVEKLGDEVDQKTLAKAFHQLEDADYRPSREARYDLESAIMQVDAFLTNFVFFDPSQRFNLREAFSDDEMLLMGMEFERNRSDYRNHQRAVRYANRKK